MKKLILSLILLAVALPSWAGKSKLDCGMASKQAAVYMHERQAGKNRKDMTFSTKGVRPHSLKRLYKEIILDAHQEPLVEDAQVQQMVANSFQEKWYRECLRRTP